MQGWLRASAVLQAWANMGAARNSGEKLRLQKQVLMSRDSAASASQVHSLLTLRIMNSTSHGMLSLGHSCSQLSFMSLPFVYLLSAINIRQPLCHGLAWLCGLSWVPLSVGQLVWHADHAAMSALSMAGIWNLAKHLHVQAWVCTYMQEMCRLMVHVLVQRDKGFYSKDQAPGPLMWRHPARTKLAAR